MLRNRGKNTGTWPFKYCDARGEGGYIVAAPSLHHSGRQYTWSQVFDAVTVPEIGPELLKVWQDPPDDPRNSAPLGDDSEGEADDGEAHAGDGQGEVTAEYFLAKYMRLVLEGGADRNPTGFALGLQLRDAPLTYGSAVPFMKRYQRAVMTARPDKPDYTWDEAEDSLKQAYSQPARKPGAVPDDGAATWAARQYLIAYRDRLRYDHVNRRWLAWDGRYWEPNLEGEAGRLGQELVIKLYGDAHVITDTATRKTALSRVMKLDSLGNIHGMAQLAAEWDPIRTKPSAFDKDGWLATAANGTLDLRLECSPDDGGRARLREHRQTDMLTRQLGKHAPLA